ncbi:MAG TPA: glutamate--tRNA ligase [Gemmatimonadaceae bacterium]|nr:glutamate--tRNA ligase [Gemmatimonadaceae bacterium]
MVPRVRFAPSPTGYLHVGGARTALFNWLYARKLGGAFLLRVEDTDKARSTDESTRAIFEGLRWLGLNWDEDVVFQGASVERHRADAQKLLTSGHAYRDFTTPEELERQRAAAKASGVPFRFDRSTAELAPDEMKRRLDAGMPFAIRFRVPDGETSWDDLVHERITFPNKDIEDFVILRSDGTPVYNFAVVSDDIAMRITLVLRGDDHISNTPKQILLYRAFGVETPQFGHLPMIHGTDGKKLSKRHGAAAVADWQHVGIVPSAMVNFLSLLGWSPGHDIEVMTANELLERFDTAGLLKKPSVFDPKKLEWMNGQHVSRMSASELLPQLRAHFAHDGAEPAWLTKADPARLNAVIELAKVRSRTTLQLADQVRAFFAAPDLGAMPDAAAKLLRGENAARSLDAVRTALTSANGEWTVERVQALLEPVPGTLGIKAGDVFQPLRAALTGSNVSPEIYAVVYHIGRDESVARIGSALATVKRE